MLLIANQLKHNQTIWMSLNLKLQKKISLIVAGFWNDVMSNPKHCPTFCSNSACLYFAVVQTLKMESSFLLIKGTPILKRKKWDVAVSWQLVLEKLKITSALFPTLSITNCVVKKHFSRYSKPVISCSYCIWIGEIRQ